jgi:2-oxoacid:acceptor oxidoreductase delta subunit (pyruvate/2-ketoisovalerate family)
MPELSAWRDLPHAGVVHPGDTEQVRTGGWRTGVKPAVDLSLCVNCLLCWLYCPDSACTVDAKGRFTGVDETVCKGCELCAAVCPVDAIAMVAE